MLRSEHEDFQLLVEPETSKTFYFKYKIVILKIFYVLFITGIFIMLYLLSKDINDDLNG